MRGRNWWPAVPGGGGAGLRYGAGDGAASGGHAAVHHAQCDPQRRLLLQFVARGLRRPDPRPGWAGLSRPGHVPDQAAARHRLEAGGRHHDRLRAAQGRDVPEWRQVQRRRRGLYDPQPADRQGAVGAQQLPVPGGRREAGRLPCAHQAEAGVPGRPAIHRDGAADLSAGVPREGRPRRLLQGAGRHRAVPDHQGGRHQRNRYGALRRLLRRQPEGQAGDPLHQDPRGRRRGDRDGGIAGWARRLDLGFQPRPVRTPSPRSRR